MPKLHCQQSCLTQPLESTSSLAGIFHEVLPVCLSADGDGAKQRVGELVKEGFGTQYWVQAQGHVCIM